MTPAAAAMDIYNAHRVPGVPFRDFVWWFVEAGSVVATDEVFICARPLRRDTPPEVIRDLSSPLQFPTAPDMWHIYLAAGNLSALVALRMIRPLPWISWFRRDSGRLKILPFHRLARHDLSQDAAANTAATAAGLINGT